MKVQIKSTQCISDKPVSIEPLNMDLPVQMILKRSNNHIGWSGINKLVNAKEIILIERKQ